MSATSMLTGNALTQKLWSKNDWVQMSQESVLGHLMNRGSVYVPPEVKGSRKGDQITFSYVGKATGPMYGEGETLAGNEEALDLTSQAVVWNVSRKGFKNPNDEDTIEAQRTNIEFEAKSRQAIKNRFVEVLDTAAFYHLGGASPSSLTLDGVTSATAGALAHVFGHNTPTAPSTNRIIRVNAQASDEAISSADTFSLKYVDYMLEKAGNSTQAIEYLSGRTYDLYVSHEQLVDLQHDQSGPVQWYANALAELQAGKSDNKIQNRFKNDMICAGQYRNVFIYAHPRVAYGENSSTGAVITTVRRAVMVGKDALIWASPFGGRPSDTDVPIRYKAELQDYEYYKGIEGRLIWGMDKNTPTNKEDVGVVVCSSYAATHA